MVGWIAEKYPHYAVIRELETQQRYYLFESALEGSWHTLQLADAVEFTPGEKRGDKVVRAHVTGQMFDPGTEGWA